MLNGKRYTTVNSDAGVRNGNGAIAFWIRSEDYHLRKARALKVKNLTSGEAELTGIVVALFHVLHDEYLRTADHIIVNCDSVEALKKMRENYNIPEYLQPTIALIFETIPKTKIKFKHVKGHMKKDNSKPRHHVNQWCDQELKKHY